MRQIPANASSVGHPGLALQFAEPSRGQDEIGHIFRSMRSAMNVSRQTIARRLATSTSTIDSFEAGALPTLPHWKETARIVRGYCELLRIDPEPLLWRMREQLNAQSNQARPNGAARPPRPPVAPWVRTRPAAPTVRPGKVPAPARRRTVRTVFAASAPIAIAVGVAILTQVAPGPIYRAVGLLPGLIGSPARAGIDQVMLLTAPRREGLRWIEVGDPRLRKADKLQTSTR